MRQNREHRMPIELLPLQPAPKAETPTERLARREALLKYSHVVADVIAERAEYPDLNPPSRPQTTIQRDRKKAASVKN